MGALTAVCVDGMPTRQLAHSAWIQAVASRKRGLLGPQQQQQQQQRTAAVVAAAAAAVAAAAVVSSAAVVGNGQKGTCRCAPAAARPLRKTERGLQPAANALL